MATKIAIANQGATVADCIAAMSALLPQLAGDDRALLNADLYDMREFGGEWPIRCTGSPGFEAYVFADGRRVAMSWPLTDPRPVGLSETQIDWTAAT